LWRMLWKGFSRGCRTGGMSALGVGVIKRHFVDRWMDIEESRS